VPAKKSAGKQLRDLLRREGQVLAVLGAYNAYIASMMDRAGVEAGFVGGSITGGAYTGFPDSGVLTATEAVQFGGYIAQAVSFPLILDGDTGHGGSASVKRLVQESIRAGLAGLRLDDQPTDGKRSSLDPRIEILPPDAAVERYSAAIEARNEIDPDFVIMSKSSARDAVNGGLEECIKRMQIYEAAGVDWLHFDAPHSLDEIPPVRAAVKATLSVMLDRLERPLSLDEHRGLGLDAAWYQFMPDRVIKTVVDEFLQDYSQRGLDAWLDFREQHEGSRFLGLYRVEDLKESSQS
jgi:2-methylisocitrate lyase-like PEP mutase family enzyme